MTHTENLASQYRRKVQAMQGACTNNGQPPGEAMQSLRALFAPTQPRVGDVGYAGGGYFLITDVAPSSLRAYHPYVGKRRFRAPDFMCLWRPNPDGDGGTWVVPGACDLVPSDPGEPTWFEEIDREVELLTEDGSEL
jgi:hypothetical protein